MTQLEVFDDAKDGWGSEHGAMVLVGPPGTGKTHRLMGAWLVPAVLDGRNVLACTYTKAAAAEMRSRLAKATGIDEKQLRRTCKTIHAEAYYMVRVADGKVSLVDKGEKKTSDDEEDAIDVSWLSLMTPQEDLRKEAVRMWDKARNRYFPDEEEEDPRHLVARVYGEDRSKHELAAIQAEVVAYEEEKAVDGLVDYCDLLVKAYHLPAERRDAVIVDEAQDMTPLQIALVGKWAARADKTVYIGDPDQGIYSFAGADGTFLTRMIQGGVTARRLSKSFRVPAAPHALARRFILQNEDRVDVAYDPCERDGSVVRSDYASEAMTAMVKFLDDDATRTGFVLARSGSALGRYADVLTQEGVPYLAERGVGSAMGRKATVAVVLAVESARQTGMVRADDGLRLAEALPARKTKWFTGKKKDTVALLDGFATEDSEQLLDMRTLDRVGLNIAPFLAEPDLVSAARLVGDGKLDPLMRIVNRYGVGALRQKPQVCLTTYHTSKGREAHAVVVDLECPYPTATEIQRAGPDGERRALYVAITRTLDRLWLVSGTKCDLGAMLGLD